MGRKDITLKDYLSDTERYADLLNGSIFQGRQVIRAKELRDADTVQSKSDGHAMLERINDITMKQTKDGSLFAVWVVANQSNIDYSMPVRVMLQDSLAYDRQLKEIKRNNRNKERERKSARGQIPMKEKDSTQKKLFSNSGEFLSQMTQDDRLHPVVTLVVYWGEEKWQGAKSLHDMIDFGEDDALAKELKALVPEYPLHILNLSEVHDYNGFRTDLKLLFELYNRRNNKAGFQKYLNDHEECKQMDAETYWALSILLKAKELKNCKPQREGGKVDMCKALEELMEEGIQKGIQKGVYQGKIEGRLEALYELVQDGLLSIKDAARKASMTENAFSVEMKKAGY